jgi:hypothetical protein
MTASEFIEQLFGIILIKFTGLTKEEDNKVI